MTLIPVCLSLLASLFGAPPPDAPRVLRPGPHLLLDDYLVASSDHIMRRVNSPQRNLSEPVVTGKEDGNFQPYMTVLRDPDTRRFRLWYAVPENANQSHLAYMESEDGIHWNRPHRVLSDPAKITFGVSILDEGKSHKDPAKRYKYGWHDNGGLLIAASPDGLTWKPLVPGIVLRHDHDINNIYYDPIRHRYAANVSFYITGDTWQGRRRVTKQSTSEDLIHWTDPWLIITPDAEDPGETQFYCMGAVVARGDLLVGMVRVLRDDLPAVAGGPVAGLGYTTLAWSRDGKTWHRDRTPFLDRDPREGAWDHAMTWVDCQLPVGNEIFLYYGGYKRGHKTERFTERQIGLVRMKKDRYVAREAGETPGLLRTPLLTLDAQSMTLNVEAPKGEVWVQVLDEKGKPLPGFTFADCSPIRTDSTGAPVRWKQPLSRLKGKPVHLEFRLQQAALFAFNLK